MFKIRIGIRIYKSWFCLNCVSSLTKCLSSGGISFMQSYDDWWSKQLVNLSPLSLVNSRAVWEWPCHTQVYLPCWNHVQNKACAVFTRSFFGNLNRMFHRYTVFALVFSGHPKAVLKKLSLCCPIMSKASFTLHNITLFIHRPTKIGVSRQWRISKGTHPSLCLNYLKTDRSSLPWYWFGKYLVCSLLKHVHPVLEVIYIINFLFKLRMNVLVAF